MPDALDYYVAPAASGASSNPVDCPWPHKIRYRNRWAAGQVALTMRCTYDDMDPRAQALNAYPCQCRGWHIGHVHGWRQGMPPPPLIADTATPSVPRVHPG